jgi:hypothetical protein
MFDIKTEEYAIITEGVQPETHSRLGFGAASELIQKLLKDPSITKVTINIKGQTRSAQFSPEKQWKLIDIKQRIKLLSNNDL